MKFDDLDYPSANVLYIHLFGGHYYNDKIYAKKKFDLERELLFFIAGNLGVSNITYAITNKETTISKISGDVNVKTIKNQMTFTRLHTETTSSECVERYENNGAIIFFDANGDIEKLERAIRKSLEPINSPVFNYGFYKSNPQMVAFVCKRFLFKMNILDYSSESEDVSEMSLTVQSCFADYGLQVAFESSTTITEKVKYKLEFHTEKDLLEVYFQKKYRDIAGDPFVMIRKFYDEDKSRNQSESKNIIKNYIITQAYKCKYNIRGCSTQNTFSSKLDEYIKKWEAKLILKYKDFYTTRDIKKWFCDTLLNPNKEEVADDFLISISTGGDFSSKDIDSQLAASNINNINNIEKTYSDKLATLENELQSTKGQLNIFQNQSQQAQAQAQSQSQSQLAQSSIEYTTRLEKLLIEAQERLLDLESRVSNGGGVNVGVSVGVGVGVGVDTKDEETQLQPDAITHRSSIPSIESQLLEIRRELYEQHYRTSQAQAQIPRPSLSSEYIYPITLVEPRAATTDQHLEPVQYCVATPCAREAPETMARQSNTVEPHLPLLLTYTPAPAQTSSPAPSLTLSENSLKSATSLEPSIVPNIAILEASADATSANSPPTKTPEELLDENADDITKFLELHQSIANLKTEISNKSAKLEKLKAASKDTITQQLIELSSSQNALQSLRSRRLMEQIRQTSNKNLEDDNNDAFDKLICMFSRANAGVINIDKQITKATEKCKKLEDEIGFNKRDLESKQIEIERIAWVCDNKIEEQAALEQELLSRGISRQQLETILSQPANSKPSRSLSSRSQNPGVVMVSNV